MIYYIQYIIVFLQKVKNKGDKNSNEEVFKNNLTCISCDNYRKVDYRNNRYSKP